MTSFWKLLATVFGLIGIGAVVYVLCSGERRERVADGIVSIGHVFTGEGNEEQEPKVIRDAKVKELWRQSNTWTIENIHKEPVLFLREKLGDLDRLQEKLETELLALNTKFAGMRIQAQKYHAQGVGAEEFIRKGLKAYEASEKSGEWPVEVNGYLVEKARLERLICDAERRKTMAEKQVKRLNAFQARLKLAISKIRNEALPQVDETRQRAEMMLEELKAKQMMDDVADVGSVLEALQAQMEGFDLSGLTFDSFSLDEIMQPSEEQVTKEDFEKIRATYTQPSTMNAQ